MKITKEDLQQIIKEELANIMQEQSRRGNEYETLQQAIEDSEEREAEAERVAGLPGFIKRARRDGDTPIYKARYGVRSDLPHSVTGRVHGEGNILRTMTRMKEKRAKVQKQLAVIDQQIAQLQGMIDRSQEE